MQILLSKVLSINCMHYLLVTQGNPFHSDIPPPDRCVAVGEMITSIVATLQIVRSLLTAGRQVDIEGLDRVVGVLCARALDLPPEQGRMVRPNLAILLIELDTLSVALNAS